MIVEAFLPSDTSGGPEVPSPAESGRPERGTARARSGGGRAARRQDRPEVSVALPSRARGRVGGGGSRPSRAKQQTETRLATSAANVNRCCSSQTHLGFVTRYFLIHCLQFTGFIAFKHDRFQRPVSIYFDQLGTKEDQDDEHP